MTNSQSSVKEKAEPQKSGEPVADPTVVGRSLEVSLSEEAADLDLSLPAQKPEPAAAKATTTEPPQKPEGEPGEPAKADSLGELLGKEESLTFTKKDSKFPDVRDGEVVKGDDGTYTIKAKHVYDDLDSIFGISEGKEPKLETFFLINKHKPQKADLLAKAAGFKTRHHLTAAIEDFRDAKNNPEEQAKILEDQFPEWTRYGSGAEAPFRVDLNNALPTSQQPSTVKSVDTFPYSHEDLDSAIDSYVAENNNVTKQGILESAKLKGLLVEFSDFEKNGKRITAIDALKLAIPQAGITKTPLSKSDKTALGGGGNQPPIPSVKRGKALTPGMKALMSQTGMSEAEFVAYEKANNL